LGLSRNHHGASLPIETLAGRHSRRLLEPTNFLALLTVSEALTNRPRSWLCPVFFALVLLPLLAANVRGGYRPQERTPEASCVHWEAASIQAIDTNTKSAQNFWRSLYASPIDFNTKSAMRFISSRVAPFTACTVRPAITVAIRRARSAGLMSLGISPAL
jgi:hypothetical protein